MSWVCRACGAINRPWWRGSCHKCGLRCGDRHVRAVEGKALEDALRKDVRRYEADLRDLR